MLARFLTTCFDVRFVQKQLDAAADMWNSHKIRPTRSNLVPSGRPNIMYTTLALWGATDHLCQTSDDDIDVCRTEAVFQSDKPCDVDLYDVIISILRRDRLQIDFEDYVHLIDLYLYLKSSSIIMNQLV